MFNRNKGDQRLHSPAREPFEPFKIYVEQYEQTHGFFMIQSAAIWDYLLSLQTTHGTHGNFLEIGVLAGKSAYLGALHLRPDETCVLVDIGDVSTVVTTIEKMGIKSIAIQGLRSDNIVAVRKIKDAAGVVRFFHIDGDHTGYATENDLHIAASCVGERGIICVDDFMNPRYPQLIAAVYRFLFDKSGCLRCSSAASINATS